MAKYPFVFAYVPVCGFITWKLGLSWYSFFIIMLTGTSVLACGLIIRYFTMEIVEASEWRRLKKGKLGASPTRTPKEIRNQRVEENNVRIVKPESFIWKDNEIAKSTRLKVDLPEMAFDVSDRHAVHATFDWTA